MKGIRILQIIFAIFLIQSSVNIGAATFSVKHDRVKLLFQSSEEKTAKDAVWTAKDIFKLGVINDGTRRDGYAEYVCQVLYEHGFKGKGVWVQVIDIAKMSRNGKWVKLGQARCN